MNLDPTPIAGSSNPSARATQGAIATQVSLGIVRSITRSFLAYLGCRGYPNPSFCTPALTMTQRPARHAERGSRNVTNSDRSVAYARRESLSVGIGNRSRRSKYCYSNGNAQRLMDFRS